MGNLKKIILTLCAAICLFCFTSVQAKELDCKQKQRSTVHKKEVLTKIFPAPDQILINSDGIFVYTKDKTKLLKGEFIALENGKIYVAVAQAKDWPATAKCGHPLLHWRCGGCDVKTCQRRCRCWEIR